MTIGAGVVGAAAAVAEKIAGEPAGPVTLAATDWVPTMSPRVHVTDARPWASVKTELSESEPPPVVTVHATDMSGTPAPSGVVTAITSGFDSERPTVPDCPSPATI